MSLPPDLLIDELERQMEDPVEMISQGLDDILEGQIESTVVVPNRGPKSLTGASMVQEEAEPIRGIRSADPPPVEYSRTGIYQPPVYGTGIRPSRAGIRNPTTTFCEPVDDYVEVERCNDCPEWSPDDGDCSYAVRRRKEAQAQED